jgi:regulator of sigma D
LSKLPEAIQRQVDEAERLQKELYGQAEKAPDQTEQVVEQVEPKPEEPEAHEAEAKPVVPEAPAEDVAYWKQRFNTVQGILNSQVPRLNSDLKNANEQIEALKATVDSLQRAQAASVEQVQAERRLNDKDSETFGEDLVDLVKRGAQEAVSQVTKQFASREEQLLAQIKRLESQLGTVNQQVSETAQDRFTRALTEQVPNWQDVNTDQGFLQWLGEVDPISGFVRQAILDSAAERMDAARVSALFHAYLATKAPVKSKQQEKQQELQRQVAPNTSRAAANVSAGDRVWTASEYEHALDPRRVKELGSQKAQELYDEAERALAEGRVQF